MMKKKKQKKSKNSFKQEEAVKYLKMSIDKGNKNALNNHAIMLKSGDGCKIEYFKKY